MPSAKNARVPEVNPRAVATSTIVTCSPGHVRNTSSSLVTVVLCAVSGALLVGGYNKKKSVKGARWDFQNLNMLWD